MKEIIKLSGILCVTTVIAAGALALVNSVTEPRIEAQRKSALQEALHQVLPSAKEGVIVPVNKNGEIDYYVGYAKKDTTQKVGYILIAKGDGYSSTIETMVGLDTTGTIEGIKVLYQLETPGLGANIVEIRYGEQKPWFQVQFVGKTKDGLIVDKDGGTIRSITGATISSRAVTNSIREAIEELERKIDGFVTNTTGSSKIRPTDGDNVPCVTAATVPSSNTPRSTDKVNSKSSSKNW